MSDAAKMYKKRVIVESSSDGEGAAPVQPAKRPKPAEPTPVPAGAANARDVAMAPSAVVSVSDDDAPLVKANGASNGHARAPSDDDAPLALPRPKPAAKKPKKASGKASSSKKKTTDPDEDMSDGADDESFEDDDDAPLQPKPKKAAAPKVKAPSAPPVKLKATPKPKLKKEESIDVASPAKKPVAKGKGKAKKEGDEEDGDSDASDVHRWWDEQADSHGVKWTSLEHNGVLFPPEHEPHGVQMKYNGKPVRLPAEAEEVASFFAAILETDYPKNPTFVKNFFESFLSVMVTYPPLDNTNIATFELCDFTPIHSHLETEKAAKKSLSSAAKKVIKATRDLLEEPYKTCLLDGRKEKVGNFRVEPPGLFRGRGEHPKTGLLKTRLSPEDITINVSKGVKIPEAPAGHRWRDVVHDDKVTWLATWKENINQSVKYVFLAPGSSLKGQSDMKKFEKARQLKQHVDRIRADYSVDLRDKEMAIRQRATAIYFIDRFALRNGNEKGEDEADTVGCCSLRFEHVTLTPPTEVTFDFLGKDSIRYVNSVKVDPMVFKNLKIFKKEPKQVGDLLFDRLSTGMVNKYLTGYMDGLTAKVFRTYNASTTFVQQLAMTDPEATLELKILAYNRANRQVAVLCNHQKSVSKGHGTAMEKALDKLRAVKYQRMKLRKALLAIPANGRKYADELDLDPESDLDEDWIERHQITLVDLEREKIRKKFEKENKKLADDNEPLLPQSALDSRLEALETFAADLEQEMRDDWANSNLSDERLVAQIGKYDKTIAKQKLALTDRDEGKEISLGTSKMNYLDPRITFAWCKKFGVPVEKFFPKTLIEKFSWAAEVDEDFEF